MERVKNILQKLQEMYYAKHQKSAIDLDLMLDYTRVMYADLLEWRGAFKEEPPTAENAAPNEPVALAAAKETPVSEQEVEPQPDVQPEDKEREETASAPSETAAEDKEPVAAIPEDKAFRPMEHDEPAPKEPVPESEEVVVTTPEKEHIDTLQRDASGISFEPPSAPEPRTEIKEELLIEEPAVQQPVDEKPAPPPAAIPLPDMTPLPEKPKLQPQPANLFSAVKAPKDIRSVIGINDKYLFLNELFNNHKSNYEEALDKLNHFATGDQAEDWIRTKIAPAHKWDQEDATVTSFYTLVKRHFSER